MSIQLIPLRQSGVRLVASGLLCSLAVAGCSGGSRGGPPEVISNQKIMGQITLSVDDGTAGGPKVVNGAKKPFPASEQATKGASNGAGAVLDWFSITARANANQGAPAAPGAKPEVKSTSVESSEFTLKHDGRQVDMKVVLHWTATLKSGQATIDVAGAIGGAGGCKLAGTFTLITDPADPTGNTIDVKGAKAFKMTNGGGSSDQEITAPACTLNAGNYTLTWSVSVVSKADPKAEVNVDKAHLSLTK